MFKSPALRHAARRAVTSRPCGAPVARSAFPAQKIASQRCLSISVLRRDPSDQEHEAATTAALPGESGDHEGRFARTDEGVRIEHPEEEHMPSSQPVSGRGGSHNMRTLASFSLEGKTGVVTGGARGLGLVMSQALVISGADVAIVDMNSTSASQQSLERMKLNIFQRMKQIVRPSSWRRPTSLRTLAKPGMYLVTSTPRSGR